jgi:plastocyanin
MTDEKKDAKRGGWLKTVVGTAAGLFSGALVMYLSPLLDRVVRPAKPIANFAVEHSGLTVTFHNRSAGGGEGRWDFGDGSPLEFVAADQPTVTHTYPRPGTYTARLTVTNLLGEENERSVTIDLTDERPKPAAKPVVVDLLVRAPGQPGEPVYAPATFQFEATADNAQLYLWDFGDGTGVQLADHQTGHTFARPGTYTVTVYAFNGPERSQRRATVEVDAAPAGTLSVSLRVADEGVQVETRRREVPVSKSLTVPPGQGPQNIEQTVAARGGFEIAKVERRQSQSRHVENIVCQVTPDRRSVKLTAQVPKADKPTTAILNERLVLVEERRLKTTRDPLAVEGTLRVPGTASLRLPPVPDDWTETRRQFVLELRQDGKVLWTGADLPRNVPVTLHGRTYTLTASVTGARVQVHLADQGAGR